MRDLVKITENGLVNSTPMWSGNVNSKFLVVAMSPGEDELDKGMPLVGPTGKMLWTWFGKHGVSRADCLLLNCIGELPKGKGGKITPEQLDKYWDRFDEICAASKASVVVILGGDGLLRYTGLSGGIESWRGYVVLPTDRVELTRVRIEETVFKTGPKKGLPKINKVKAIVPAPVASDVVYIIPTLHPSGIMKTGHSTTPVFSADLERAARASKDRLDLPDDYSVGKFGPPCNKDAPIAFDIEGYDSITDISLASGTYSPWARSQKWGPEARRETKGFLTDTTRLKVAHNAAFDIQHLRDEDIEVTGPIDDTMLMAAMVFPDIPKGLKYVVPMYTDAFRWDHLYDTDINIYNALDSYHTLRLWRKLHDILVERGQYELFRKTIMGTVPTLMEMSAIGLYVDPHKRRAWTDGLTSRLESSSLKWQRKYGVPWNRPKELKSYLAKLGMDVKYNKYGKETLDENAIRTLLIEHPEHGDMLKLLLDLRGYQKDLSTYAKLELTGDNTVHPSYLPAGKDDDRYDEDGEKAGKGLAGTFRPTAKNPNIQNQTAESKLMFVPRILGHEFVEVDYCSFEAWILSALAKDEVLANALRSDLHATNMEILGVDRVRAKNAFYGWSYGAGPRTLKNTFRTKGYEISESECRSLLFKFDNAYSKSAQYRNAIIAGTAASRVVTNPFGFRRYFYGPTGTAPANTMIQSTAAFVMWNILPELANEAKRLGGFMVAMVHDSVEFELPMGSDLSGIREIMEQPFDCIAPGFSCPVEFKSGPSWGEVAKVA